MILFDGGLRDGAESTEQHNQRCLAGLQALQDRIHSEQGLDAMRRVATRALRQILTKAVSARNWPTGGAA
jgi:hypothetical protein